jgi:hypothetical protein
MTKYIQYKDTSYIILSDGTVARKLKPTKIHNQKYYNFIIGKKQERVNSDDVLEIYNIANGIHKQDEQKN